MFVRKLKTFLPIVLAIVSVAGILTFILTWLGTGVDSAFFGTWIRSFVPTACLLAPTAILATVLLSKMVEAAFPQQRPISKKIILAIMMGCVIEFFVSLLTTVTSIGLFGNDFLVHWASVYLRAIPLGICVGLFMSFVFKPWMGARMEKLRVEA